MNLGFIGTGKITSSVVTGICRSKISFEKIILSPRNRNIAKKLTKKFRKVSIAKNQLREFGFLIGFGFPIFIGWIIPAFGGHAFRGWTLSIAIPFLILGILKPRLLLFPYKGWMALGLALGWINSRIILGMVFLVILQPIALVMRLTSYDPLREKKSNQKSYREVVKDKSIDLNRIF